MVSLAFNGRIAAARASDPDVMRKSSKVPVAVQEALEYGLVEIDGKQPRPLTIKHF